MNEKEIKEVFDGIHMPPALLRKVENMNHNMENKKGKLLKAVATAAAAIAICVVASNGICYAATGQTWFSKMTVYINGKVSTADVSWTKDGDTITGTVELPDDADSTSVMVKEYSADDEDGEISVSEESAEWSEETEEASTTAVLCDVKEEGEKVYLFVENGVQKIDITEDIIADGEATGSFTRGDITYYYHVSSDVSDEYHYVGVDGEKYAIALSVEK